MLPKCTLYVFALQLSQWEVRRCVYKFECLMQPFYYHLPQLLIVNFSYIVALTPLR